MSTVANISGSHQSASDRTISMPIRGGGFMAVPCPAWCVADHTYELAAAWGVDITEIQHTGQERFLEVRIDETTVQRVMSVHLSQYPYSPNAVPELIFDTALDDAHCTPIEPHFALKAAEQFAAFADVMREAHGELQLALAEYQAAFNSEHLIRLAV